MVTTHPTNAPIVWAYAPLGECDDDDSSCDKKKINVPVVDEGDPRNNWDNVTFAAVL